MTSDERDVGARGWSASDAAGRRTPALERGPRDVSRARPTEDAPEPRDQADAGRALGDLFAAAPPPDAWVAPSDEGAGDDEGGERGSFPPDGELLAPGTMIAGRFRIERLIGRGGHGFVYEAEHVVLGYPVAIKVLHAAFGLDQRRRARFRREALLGARLRHRNVVSIHDAGELRDGSPFLVMEHVDGADLATVIDRARLDPAATIEIGEQLLAAVTALTERGVIHRDIKPNNVMLQRAVDGFVEVKLLDFGISKAMRAELALKTLTADDCVIGTPQYMSPEQVRGEVLDVRADLYAVGCLLFECVTGTPPFDAETPGAVLAKILTEDTPRIRSVRPDLPIELAGVIDRALEKRPEDRWRHPAEMSEALRSAAQRLALPRGAGAWAGVPYGGAAVGPGVPYGGAAVCPEPRATTPARLSTASEPPPRLAEKAETAPERPRSLSGRSLAAVPAIDARLFGWPTSSRARRGMAFAAVVPIAIGLGAATWAWDGGDASRAQSNDPASREVLVRVAAPKHEGAAEPEGEAGSAADAAQAALTAAEAPIPEGIETPPVQAPPRVTPSRGAAGADPAELERRALSAYLAGRDREAVSVYMRATEIAPRRASAWRGLGLTAATIGDHRTARRALRRYLVLEPRARDRAAIERRIARLGS